MQLQEGGSSSSSSGGGGRAASPAKTAFRVGDKVTAKYRGKGKWFPGKVVSVEGSGSSALYNVLYDDGDKDDGLREEFVQLDESAVVSSSRDRDRVSAVESDSKSSSSSAASASKTAFRVGDKVTAKYRGKGKWFPGKVVSVEGSGSSALYNVLYDDGDKDDGLREEFVQLDESAVVSSSRDRDRVSAVESDSKSSSSGTGSAFSRAADRESTRADREGKAPESDGKDGADDGARPSRPSGDRSLGARPSRGYSRDA